MKLRLIRRRRSPNIWMLQKRSMLFGWEYVNSYASFNAAMAGAQALLLGEHPDDIIEIVAVKGSK